jgi:hypothetical protein
MRRLDRQRIQKRPDFPIDEPTSQLEPMIFDPQEDGWTAAEVRGVQQTAPLWVRYTRTRSCEAGRYITRNVSSSVVWMLEER